MTSISKNPQPSKPTGFEPKRSKKLKPKAKRGDRYSIVLLAIMLIVAVASGVVAFRFGQKSVEGVNSVPADGSSPRLNPSNKKKIINSPKPVRSPIPASSPAPRSN